MTVPPPPPHPVECHVVPVSAGTVLHRIHDAQFEPAEFNPGLGSSRFAPIAPGHGNQVPTCYAASGFPCAAFETVFHDIDPTARFKSVSIARVATLVYSQLAPSRDLRLASLFEIDLNRWGYSRRQLIDTPASTYASTRLWSAAIHQSDPSIDGMIWTSRRDDQQRAMLLFGDRVAPHDLTVIATERIASSPLWLGTLRDLGARAGIVLTM